MATVEDKIIALEARLEKAESIISKLSELVLNGVPSTVSAPFRVVDQNGELLLEVSISDNETESRLCVFNRGGEAVASLGSDVDGGNLTIRNNVGGIVSYLRVGPDGARFSLDTNNGLGGVNFYTTESGAGLVLSDTEGKGTVELNADVNGGVLVLRNDEEIPVVVLPPEQFP